jgi:hypothetical protein
MPLDTLAHVKTRLGLTSSADDALLALLQDSADSFVAQFCRRDFAGGTFTEYHNGASIYAFLRNYPIVSVTSLRVDCAGTFAADSEWPTSAYVVQTERGVVQTLVGPFVPMPERSLLDNTVPAYPWAPRAVRVVYTTAVDSVPAEVLEAYAQLVGHWYRRIKTQAGVQFKNVTQQKLGDATSIYSKDQIAGLPLPPDVYTLLRPYRSLSV